MKRKINRYIATLTNFTRFGGADCIFDLEDLLLPHLGVDPGFRDQFRRRIYWEQLTKNKEFSAINKLAENETVLIYNNNRNAFVVGTKKYIISVIYTGDYKQMLGNYIINPDKVKVRVRKRKTEFKYN